MQSCPSALSRLSDDQLLSEVKRLASHERQATADLVASLAELDTRRLYLGQGFSSLSNAGTQTVRFWCRE